MTYPTISEYVEAIKLAEENLDQLNYLRPVLDEDGNPVMSSGNFAVVFKMQDGSGRFYALKCFTREQEGRAEAYKIICDELAKIASPYFVNTEYYDNELFVDTQESSASEFPVLLMDWVEGENLTQYLDNTFKNSRRTNFIWFGHFPIDYILYELNFTFNQFAQWMVEQPFAHGDLKPDNILIREDGSIFIVDYDGMYFPQMCGQKARELGSPDYQHPKRTIDKFNEHIDDMALASIALSLCAKSLNDKIGHSFSGTLLLTASDFIDLAHSSTFHGLLELSQKDKEIGRYLSTFMAVLSEAPLTKHLLDLKDIFIGNTEWNFRHNFWLGFHQQERIIVPKTITKIGEGAFANCKLLKSITIPNTVTEIGDRAFEGCNNLTTINVPSSITEIGLMAFAGCSQLQSFTIPNSVTSINNWVFANCTCLTNITIPESISEIWSFAFENCIGLTSIELPDTQVLTIFDEAFVGCKNLQEVHIPIGCDLWDNAFDASCEINWFPPSDLFNETS